MKKYDPKEFEQYFRKNKVNLWTLFKSFILLVLATILTATIIGLTIAIIIGIPWLVIQWLFL